MTVDCDVAIVGAGPTGLTLANILGQMGIRTVLIERNQATVREPRAVSIDDESLRTMQAIGLLDEVLDNVALDYGSHYFTPGGRRFAIVAPSTREYGFPRRSAFQQPKLEATLRDGLHRYANVTCLFGCAYDASEVHPDRIDISLTSQDGRRYTLNARYLVGCDGARSVIRKQIGSTLSGSSYDKRWLIVDLASTKERLRQTRVVCNPQRPFLTLPGPAGVRRYEFMLHDHETDQIAGSPDFVKGLLAANGPDADEPIVRRQVYTFHARIADRWRSDRIFLAGDAAHLSPPFAGQGMNSGIRDAQNLGWKLATVVAGEIGPRLLDTYQPERAPHARALVQLAVNMGRIMMPTSQVQAWLTQAAFRLTKLAPRLQAHFAEMKYKPKPFYRDGFVTPEDAGLGIAGRMVPQPNIDLGGGKSAMLDELLGQNFALLAFGPNAQSTLATAARHDFGFANLRKIAILPGDYNPGSGTADADIIGRDMANLFQHFVPVGSDCLILVRPDRYIAAAATASEDAVASMATRLRALIADSRAPQEASAAARTSREEARRTLRMVRSGR